MNLALGHKCVAYDFGTRKPVPIAVYQGLEFVKHVLNCRWLNKEYITIVNRSKTKRERIITMIVLQSVMRSKRREPRRNRIFAICKYGED